MTKEQIISGASTLSAADRRTVALALWPDVAEEASPAAPVEFWAEMDRRVAAYQRDPSQLLTREQFDSAVAARIAAMRAGPGQ